MIKDRLNRAYETIGKLACRGVRFDIFETGPGLVEVYQTSHGPVEELLVKLELRQGADETVDEMIVRVAATAKAAVL